MTSTTDFARVYMPVMSKTDDEREGLIRAYEERPKPAGVFQIKNTVNGKLLLGSTLNLKGAQSQLSDELARSRRTFTIARWTWRARSQTLATALVAFWPYSIINSGRLNNDIFVYATASVAMYGLMRW